MERAQHLKCKQEVSTIQQQYNQIKAICEVDKQKIEEYYKKLITKASQKPKEVKIPVIIEKSVPVTPEECQKLGVMIDEAVELINSDK